MAAGAVPCHASQLALGAALVAAVLFHVCPACGWTSSWWNSLPFGRSHLAASALLLNIAWCLAAHCRRSRLDSAGERRRSEGSRCLRLRAAPAGSAPATRPMLAALLLLMPPLGLAGDYCRAEIESACPDRPGAELAACLKDPSEHDKPTTISSECTDFVAVNVACADTIEKFCDGNFFSADTALCLTQWTDQQSIPAKCAGVLKWAIPKEENQDDRGPTDELGLSEKDYQEKKAWQAKRKAERGAAVEKMRESDKEKREMERLKREHPEDYKVMMKEKEERAKEIEAQRKRERLVAAAKERKRREEAKANGELEEEPEDQPAKGKRRVVHSRPPPKRTWLPYALFGCGGAFVFFNVLNWFYKGGDKGDEEDKEE